MKKITLFTIMILLAALTKSFAQPELAYILKAEDKMQSIQKIFEVQQSINSNLRGSLDILSNAYFTKLGKYDSLMTVIQNLQEENKRLADQLHKQDNQMPGSMTLKNRTLKVTDSEVAGIIELNKPGKIKVQLFMADINQPILVKEYSTWQESHLIKFSNLSANTIYELKCISLDIADKERSLK